MLIFRNIIAVSFLVLFCACQKNDGPAFHYYKENGSDSAKTTVTVRLSQKEVHFLNKGFQNGTYWLYFPSIENNALRYLQFNSAHLQHVEGFQKGDKLQPLAGMRYPTYEIHNQQALYFRINCEKEGYVPVRRYRGDLFIKEQNNEILGIGFYYGIATMVIIFNLLLYFIFRDLTFLAYSCFTVCVSLSLFYSDGMFNSFGFNDLFLRYFETIVHPAAAILGSIFAIKYLQLDVYVSRIKKITYALLSPLPLFAALYFATSQYPWFALIEIWSLCILSFYWLQALRFIRKNLYARYFALAYLLILLLAIDFYLSKAIGITFFAISASSLKIGGIFEMALLTFSVYYRMRQVNKLYKEMEQAIIKYIEQISLLTTQNELAATPGTDGAIDIPDLTTRELQIVQLLKGGKTNKEIADALFISINTVKFHIKRVYEKMQINSRKELEKLTIATATPN